MRSTFARLATGSGKLLLLASAAACLAGCAGLERAAYQTQVETLPATPISTNTVLHTNVVEIAASTNELTGEVIPAREHLVITPETTVEYAPAVTRTNLVPRPEIVTALQTGGSLPIPGVGLALSLIGLAYQTWANIRNKKTAVAVIKGIEAGRKMLQQTPEGKILDEKIKQMLIEKQAASGVLEEVGKLLQQYVPSR